MYAQPQDVAAGFRELSGDETKKAESLLSEASVIIDAYSENATDENKKVVSCRMVRRALGEKEDSIPIGASQFSQSALGYGQSFTFGSGSSGELYLDKIDKKLLGFGDRIGFAGPLNDLEDT